MDKITKAVSGFLRDEEGQDIIEYGLLAAFIAIAVVVTLVGFKTELERIYKAVLDALKSA